MSKRARYGAYEIGFAQKLINFDTGNSNLANIFDKADIACLAGLVYYMSNTGNFNGSSLHQKLKGSIDVQQRGNLGGSVMTVVQISSKIMEAYTDLLETADPSNPSTQ